MAPLNWGILSTGKISHDFVASLQGKSNHKVVACASRSLENAKKFAGKFSISSAYDDYEQLVKNPEVTAVYIGSLNPQHLSLAKLALSHGKPVLCEKPMCMNLKETQQLVAFAREKRVFLMEAVWSRFFPAYLTLRGELKKGTIGEIFQVVASFGLPISEVDRCKLKELGGSTLLDIGIYCVQFTLFTFGWELKPLKIVANGHLNSQGVDESCSVVITYPGQKTATLIINGRVQLENEATVFGTKGSLKVATPFWCPTNLIYPDGSNKTFKLPETDQQYNYGNSQGLFYEAEEVYNCVHKGLIESPSLPLDESLAIAKILQEVRQQLGVHYSQDDE